MNVARQTRDAGQQLGLTILGATGSVGASTLDVVARHPERYRVVALTAHRSEPQLLELAVRHQPEFVVLSGLRADAAIRRRFSDSGFRGEVRFGADALEEAAMLPRAEAVMAAIVGAAGLVPTLAAARAGKRVLLANKEALVMAGPLFMQTARAASATLLPIDSEHNAVFQCLPQDATGRIALDAVTRIMLTASGGPFRRTPLDELHAVTPDEACAHPNWVMGRKISVDSASMMNKGLEVIEAHWLFGLEPRRIEVVIHPESIVHSLVEYVDGSVIAQLSNPDMRVPIAHALAFPERTASGVTPLDLGRIAKLTFEAPDLERFRCLRFAYECLTAGGTAPALLNAANEVAVEAFLGAGLRFTGIATVIEEVLNVVPVGAAQDLEAILAADTAARDAARRAVRRLAELAA